MVTVNVESVKRFYNTVGRIALDDQRFQSRLHFPDGDCFVDEYTFTPDRCNWRALFHLAAWFFKYGPDVSEFWKRAARLHDLRPDDLHDLMLGAFISGEGGSDDWFRLFGHITDSKLNWIIAHEEIPAP